MGFWNVVGAVMMAMVIMNAINALCKALSKWIDKKVADEQLKEIHALADFIVKNQK